VRRGDNLTGPFGRAPTKLALKLALKLMRANRKRHWPPAGPPRKFDGRGLEHPLAR
jgi:hypothetical protein